MNRWYDKAACAGRWYLFDDEHTDYESPEEAVDLEKHAKNMVRVAIRNRAVRAAISICAECPVRQECLEDSLKYADFEGIRAGFTGPQREQIARARGISTTYARRMSDELDAAILAARRRAAEAEIEALAYD